MKLKLFFLTCAAICFSGCDPRPSDHACEVSNSTTKANAEAQKSSNDLQIAMQSRVMTLQMDIAKKCFDRGGLPAYINQNVACNPASK